MFQTDFGFRKGNDTSRPRMPLWGETLLPTIHDRLLDKSPEL